MVVTWRGKGDATWLMVVVVRGCLGMSRCLGVVERFMVRARLVAIVVDMLDGVRGAHDGQGGGAVLAWGSGTARPRRGLVSEAQVRSALMQCRGGAMGRTRHACMVEMGLGVDMA